ncbi:MAG: RNA polymerase sigma factor [Pseudomonadota bacterium]
MVFIGESSIAIDAHEANNSTARTARPRSRITFPEHLHTTTLVSALLLRQSLLRICIHAPAEQEEHNDNSRADTTGVCGVPFKLRTILIANHFNCEPFPFIRPLLWMDRKTTRVKSLKPTIKDAVALSSGNSVPGESSVLQRWYEEHYGPLVAHLRKRFGAGPPDPEDVAQQTFKRLLTQPSLAEIDNPGAYLRQMARNLAISLQRSTTAAVKRDSEWYANVAHDGSYDLAPERVLLAKEQLKLAIDVVNRMPTQRRRAFVYVRIDGLTVTAAARLMGISGPAVHKHIQRATADMFDALVDSSANSSVPHDDSTS